MQRRLYRTASWVLALVVLASTFAALFGTAAASPTTYVLTGFVDQPGGLSAPPVPAGVTVDLVSRATGAVYSTSVVGRGGEFAFTSSGTGNALVPGYWGLYVPAAGNVSLTGCARCAVLPQQQTPLYKYYSTQVLTNATYVQVLTNVSILPYNATLNGTVTQSGAPVAGATVQLLAPTYDGLVLVSNVTNATGFYNLSVPFGTWVLQVSHLSGPDLYTNSTLVRVTSQTPPHVNPILKDYAISGRAYSSVTGGYVTTPGNATLYDPVNHYLYSDATPPGGFYSFPSYVANFTHGSQPFYVVVDPAGFQPAWFNLSVAAATAYTRSVTVKPLTQAELGVYNTQLNFSAINPATGRGSLTVDTGVRLGNDTVLSQLPNASVGQLWAQLGLDFNHSMSFPSADVSTVLENWIASQGPFFPAVEAGTTLNGTGFVAPTGPQALTTPVSSTCGGPACGLTSAASVSYGWKYSYALNGTVPKNSSSYVLSFRFAHPAAASSVYNYTIVLPQGYALYAGTTAPAATALYGKGAEGTWTNFTLESKSSSTAAATATFTLIRQSNFTANVAITSSNFTFSERNILNATHNNYTVVLGVGENATFSSAPSVYPAGSNGTRFNWSFGDRAYSNTTNLTTYHNYSAVGTYHGSLRIISSSGLTNSTTFNISVVATAPTAAIASNASAFQNKTAGTTKYLFVNWTTTLQFNATLSSIVTPNNLSIALYTLTAHGFSTTANFSASAGASPYSNWTVAFGSNTTNSTTAPGHGYYVNFANVNVNGHAVSVRGYGWIYNLTLEVWSLVGTTSVAHLTILVNDTEPPVPAITLLNSAGRTISGSIVEGANHLATVLLDGNKSADYGNGSNVKYRWYVNNTNTTSFHNITINATSAKPLGQFPTVHLPPETSDYAIKLVVWDKNGNQANTTVKLDVAQNTTLRPIMAANNLTGPASVNVGSTYTYWVNVTVSGGSKAVANTITVWFYLLSASGTGSRQYIAGSPGSVVFYGYSNSSSTATVNATSLGTGSVSALKYGKTVRAVLKWDPSKSGSFILYAYATADNQFVNNSSVSIASVPITVHPNPTTQLLEDAAIVAAVVVVLALIVLWVRRRGRVRKGGPVKPTSGRSGLERTAKRPDDEDDEP